MAEVITADVISCCLCLRVLTFMPADPPALAFSVCMVPFPHVADT